VCVSTCVHIDTHILLSVVLNPGLSAVFYFEEEKKKEMEKKQ